MVQGVLIILGDSGKDKGLVNLGEMRSRMNQCSVSDKPDLLIAHHKFHFYAVVLIPASVSILLPSSMLSKLAGSDICTIQFLKVYQVCACVCVCMSVYVHTQDLVDICGDLVTLTWWCDFPVVFIFIL